jgi:DNA primase
MDQATAKLHIKDRLENYLNSKGISISRPFNCLNPGHEDSHPSMSYDKKRNKCHCFSCGADYDIFDLIGIEYDLIEPKETFSKAYELYDVSLYDNCKKDNNHTKTKMPEQSKKSDYPDFFQEAHKHVKETDYLQQRGFLSEETINRFLLGLVCKIKKPVLFNQNSNRGQIDEC